MSTQKRDELSELSAFLADPKDSICDYRIAHIEGFKQGWDAHERHHKERSQRLLDALKALEEAASCATNWSALAQEKVGSSPWIDQYDALDIDAASIAAREAIEEYTKGEK